MNNENFRRELTSNEKLRIKFLSGFLGSAATVLVCSPLDLVKVRMQVSHSVADKDNYSQLKKTIFNTFTKEGFKGFYNGVKSGMTTSPIYYSIYFPVYENSKSFFSNLLYGKSNNFDSYVYTLSASTAALCSNLVTTPMWVVRVRFQTQFMYDNKSGKESFNVIKSISHIYKTEGFFALYRGLLIELIGTPQVVIQFNLYEYFNKKLKDYSNQKDLAYKYVILSSVLSKSNFLKLVIASICMYPYEVIRNGLQSSRNYKEEGLVIKKLFLVIYKSRGYSGFYYGFILNIFRILPNTAIMFCFHEYFSRLFTNILVN